MSFSTSSNTYNPQEAPSLNTNNNNNNNSNTSINSNTSMLFYNKRKRVPNDPRNVTLKVDKKKINTLAFFTNKGILIKSEKSISKNAAVSSSSNISRSSFANNASNTTFSNPFEDNEGIMQDYERGLEYTAADSDGDDDGEEYETTSLISCVTCLSSNSLSTLSLSERSVGISSDDGSRSMNLSSSFASSNISENNDHVVHTDGVQTLVNDLRLKKVHLPNNSVIPFSKILNCRTINKPVSERGGVEEEEDDDDDDADDNNDNNDNDDNDDDDGDGEVVEGVEEEVEPLVDLDVPGNNKTESSKRDQEHLVEITFAKSRRQDLVPKSSILKVSHAEYLKLLGEYQKAHNNTQECKKLSELVLWKSFPNEKENHYKKILVIINPKGGKGKANKLFLSKARPILLASGCTIDYKETTYYKEAYFFTKKHQNLLSYDIIACASGDGIPHEVLNGLYKRKRDRVELFNKVCITQIPCGSGNAMSVSCHGTSNPSLAALNLLKGKPTKTDLMLLTQPSYFRKGLQDLHGGEDNDDDDEDSEDPHMISFLSQAYGIIAESDINTEYLRFLGPSRFELGVTSCVLRKKRFPCDVFVKYGAKSKRELRDHFNKNCRYVKTDGNSDNYHDNDEDDEDDDEDEEEEEEEEGNANNESTDAPAIDEELTEDSFKPKYGFPEESFKYTDDIPDDWEQIDSELTKNCGIFYTGKMPYIAEDCKFFPAALPDDGVMDLVITDARTSITRTVPILLSLDKGSHVLQPEVVHSKVKALRLIPYMTKSVISVDGENFPMEPMQVEVLPRICKMILLSNGNFVDTGFNKM